VDFYHRGMEKSALTSATLAIGARTMVRRTVSRGFTLIELMVVLSIVGILMGLGIPSFKRTISQNNINSGIGTLASDINFARSEALKRGLSVTLCPSLDPYTACAAAGTNWQNGWIVFLDRDANNTRDTAAGTTELLLRVQQNLAAELTMLGSAGAAVNSIRFDRSGSASAALGLTVQSQRLDVAAQGQTVRTACISISGRTRVTAPGHDTCQ
jgi:type IV fimbrial biogenesis protein FimT